MRLSKNCFGLGKPAVPEIELLSCRRLLVAGGWRLPDLRAPYWRLYRNRDEGAAIVRPDGTVELRRDRFYLIAPETVGHGTQQVDFDQLFLHFLVGAPYDRCRNFIWELPEDPILRHAVAVITVEQRHPLLTPVAAMAAMSLCAAALTQLPKTLLPVRAPDPQLQAVLEELNAHPERHYVNRELAERIGMSVNTFLRRFHAACGKSPQQYLTEARLRRACVLLQYSSLSMEEIAERTGFCDRFYFTRMFTRCRQLSPAAFRKLNELRPSAV